MAQSVKRLTPAQVMISWFVSFSPESGSVLTAQSLEPTSDSVSPLSLPLPCSCSVSFCFSIINKTLRIISRGAWVAQSVERPTSAQVMISPLVSSSPASGSVLTAQSLEPASDSVSPSPSLTLPRSCSVSLCLKNKR